ncbi:MAG TPA: hypothetical protein VN832_08510 [Stellaceae bacterium]|nr:hypothetical protein [Stellaceae bacterium]
MTKHGAREIVAAALLAAASPAPAQTVKVGVILTCSGPQAQLNPPK